MVATRLSLPTVTFYCKCARERLVLYALSRPSHVSGANGEEQANNSSIQLSSDGPQVIPVLLYNNHHQSVIFNNSQTLSHHLLIPNTSRDRSLHPKTPPNLHHHVAHTRLQRQIQTLPTLHFRRPRRNHRAPAPRPRTLPHQATPRRRRKRFTWACLVLPRMRGKARPRPQELRLR